MTLNSQQLFQVHGITKLRVSCVRTCVGPMDVFYMLPRSHKGPSIACCAMVIIMCSFRGWAYAGGILERVDLPAWHHSVRKESYKLLIYHYVLQGHCGEGHQKSINGIHVEIIILREKFKIHPEDLDQLLVSTLSGSASASLFQRTPAGAWGSFWTLENILDSKI